MHIDEMHVVVELGAQKIASNQWDNISSEEMDVVLNIAQEQYAKNQFRPAMPQAPGFQSNERRLDNLRELIVKNHKVQTYLSIEGQLDYETNVVAGYLPADYMFLINDRSRVIQEISGGACKLKPRYEKKNATRTFFVVPFAESGKDRCPFYTDVKFTVGVSNKALTKSTVTLFDISKTGYKSGIDSKEQSFEVIRLIVDSLNQLDKVLGISAYWEQVDDLYYPNSFIIVADKTEEILQHTQLTAYFDDSNSPVAVTTLTRAYTEYDVQDTDTVKYSYTYATNRLHQTEELYEMLRHPFGMARARSPISTIATNKLYLYEGDNYIIQGAQIDYIKRPRRLSKRLGISSELAEHTHQEICELAIAYIKRTLMTPDYERVAQDNIRNNG